MFEISNGKRTVTLNHLPDYNIEHEVDPSVVINDEGAKPSFATSSITVERLLLNFPALDTTELNDLVGFYNCARNSPVSVLFTDTTACPGSSAEVQTLINVDDTYFSTVIDFSRIASRPTVLWTASFSLVKSFANQVSWNKSLIPPLVIEEE